MEQWIIGVIATLATAAVTAPLLPWVRASAVNWAIWFNNKRRGRPTFVPGTPFLSLTTPSGKTFGASAIERVDHGFVYVRIQNGGVVPIKKIDFKGYNPEIDDQNPAYIDKT